MFLHNIVRFMLATILAGTVFQAAAQESVSETLKRIKDSGTITLGYRAASIPFSYTYQDNGTKIAGYSIDLCMKVVDEVRNELKMPGLKVAYKLVSTGTRIPMISDGSIDIECGSSTHTATRERYAAFSTTFFVSTTRLASRKGSGIQSLEDLGEFKAVVSSEGSNGTRLVNQYNVGKKPGVNLVSAKNHTAAFKLLESNKANAFINGDVLLWGLIATSETPGDFVVSDKPLSIEPYGMILAQDDPQFKKVVDRAIIKTFESGEIEMLYKKWFILPIPPKGTVLNIPMSPQLRRVLEQPTDSNNPKDYPPPST